MIASYVFMNCSKLYIILRTCARIAHRQYRVAIPARYIHGLCIAEAFGSETMLIHMYCSLRLSPIFI